ncbi:FAD-binding oxidoreductase [Glaciihabitans sp. UYNi722]|uniref:FAD-binding oxidoreductase n=1 Tax=Glaciihabitans sp. UYNi722 TaxID=3156344 RepID=UPI003394C632
MKAPLPLEDLRAIVAGPVLGTSDGGFAEEVSAFNRAFIRTPDVAVGATSEADVVEAVRFAAAHNLRVRMQATGHGAESAITDGLLITTQRLYALSVDGGSRIARIGAGVRWGSVLTAAEPLGLTAITGASGNVGAIGYTLGGGVGPLSRSHGVSSDYARGFRLVTADGSIVTADAEENSDLFWALRGGKGGFGVVTEMQFELVPLTALYAGSIFFDTPHIETVLRSWIDWSASADATVTTSFAIMRLPDFDAIPQPLRGRTVLNLRFAYPGGETEGKRLATPLRELAPAIIDTIGVLPASQVGTIHNDLTEPGPGWVTGGLLNDLDQDFATELLATVGPDQQVPFIVVEIRQLGGRTFVDVPEGSAVGGRASGYTLSLVGVPNPDLFAQVLPAVANQVMSAIAPWISPETTINFAGDGSDAEQFGKAWPSAISERLSSLRMQWDPTGLFAYGPPAG